MTIFLPVTDENSALRRVRELVGHEHAGTLDPDDVPALCQAFRALDDWLTTGNALPRAWQRATRRGVCEIDPSDPCGACRGCRGT